MMTSSGVKRPRVKTQNSKLKTKNLDDDVLRREKAKGRLLRATAWWKRQKDKGTCYYCHQTFKPSLLTMDHIVPLARGGRSVRGNVVPACKACNNDKKNNLVMEWEGILSLDRKEVNP